MLFHNCALALLKRCGCPGCSSNRFRHLTVNATAVPNAITWGQRVSPGCCVRKQWLCWGREAFWIREQSDGFRCSFVLPKETTLTDYCHYKYYRKQGRKPLELHQIRHRFIISIHSCIGINVVNRSCCTQFSESPEQTFQMHFIFTMSKNRIYDLSKCHPL